MSKKDDEIVVTALDREVTFRDREELAEHVAEILEARGGIFSPIEQAAIRELARLNGAEMPRVKRIARALEFHAPPKPPKRPTPLDDRIAAREQRVAELEAAMREASARWRGRADELEAERRHRVAKAGEDRDKIHRVHEWVAAHQGEIAVLREEALAAESSWRRAHAGLSTLRMAADRWRIAQDARFHNADDPTSPLTLEELRERQGRRRRR